MSNQEGRIEHFRATLKAAGLKATSARLKLMLLLDTTKKPISVIKLQKALPDIDPVTIYRTLISLKGVHMVKQIDFQHGHAHFELAELGDHHHIICTECHHIEDVENCVVEKVFTRLSKTSSFAVITDHSLEFFGICKQCQI